MLPFHQDWQKIVQLRKGPLNEVPFSVLLLACYRQEKTLQLELTLNQLKKSILLENGVPVACQSNILQETFGQHLVMQGKITEKQNQMALIEAAKSERRLGEILLEKKILNANDLFKELQKNLAKKLLDCFSWKEGEFKIISDYPDPDSPLKVNVPQLIITGITRFADETLVKRSLQQFLEHSMAINPRSSPQITDLKISSQYHRVVTLLQSHSTRNQLFNQSQLTEENLDRFLCALVLLGIICKTEDLPKEVSKPKEEIKDIAEETSINWDEVKDQIHHTYLQYRKWDAFELLGLSIDASILDIRKAFLNYSKRYSFFFDNKKLPKDVKKILADKAQDLFLAGARAYGMLMDGEIKQKIISRRLQKEKQQKTGKKKPDFSIRTDLLDVTKQFREGMRRKNAGKFLEAQKFLEFAVQCSPERGDYRAELAHCDYLYSPQNKGKANKSLQEAMRLDPSSGLAWFYAGEIYRAEGNLAEAESHYRKACKLMKEDRRPTEALKELLQKRK